MEVMPPESLYDFILWIRDPVFAGIILSFLMQQVFPRFELSDTAKSAIAAVVCIGLGVISKLIIDYVPAETIEALSPWWTVFYYGLVVWASSQAAHAVRKLTWEGLASIRRNNGHGE